MTSKFKKIVVRSPNWIGDQVLAFPFYYYLRDAFPSAKITVACPPWVQSVQFRNLVDQVVVLPVPQKATLWDKWKNLEKSAAELRKLGPWDLGISLPRSFSSAWLMARSQIRLRRGYVSDGRGFLLNDPFILNEKKSFHRSEEYVHLLSKEVRLKCPVQEFWGSATDRSVVDFDPRTAWPHENPIEPPTEPYWVLAPGSMAESRRWPESYFVSLATEIVQKTSWSGIIVGGPAESKLGKTLSENLDLKLQDWTNRGSAASYWKIFQKAQVTVANDSGLAHVAALCGSTVQVIWGAGKVARTQPLGPGKVRLSVNPVECWPCERNECLRLSGQKLECLLGIHPEGVSKEVLSDFKRV